MRPKILDKLFKPIETTKGIGPRLKVKLKYLIGENIVDYLWHLPNNIIDRSYKPKIISAEIAVLNRIASTSSVTFLMAVCSTLS